MSKSKFVFDWDLTDENFKAMMKGECRTGLFGSVRIGTMLVEFRCIGGGVDPDECEPTTDIYVFGKEDPVEKDCTNLYFGNKSRTPYIRIHDYVPVPQRRDLEHFKVAFELRFVGWLSNVGKKYWEEIRKPTISKEAWDTGIIKEEKPAERQKLCIDTPCGTLTAQASPDRYYPGFWISLKRPDGTFDMALIEVDMLDGNVPMFKAHIYAPGKDEPVYDARFAMDEIDREEFGNKEE